MLERGAGSATDPLRTAVLGISGPTGCELRTVILRRVVTVDRILICNTDTRSPKVQQIKNNSRVSWLFYHPEPKIQLRLHGPATLHTADTLADAQWAAANLTSRLNYLTSDAPGAIQDKPTTNLPDFLIDRPLTLEQSEAGRKNFAVIACRIDFMDCLQLHPHGHRRAQFAWREDKLTANWVTP